MREAVRLGRNFAAVTGAQFIVQVLTFLLSVTLARRLGTTSYGIFVFGFAFPSLFLLFVSAGLDEVIARDVAADPSRARAYLTVVAVLRLPFVAVSLLALWVSLQVLLSDPFARAVTLLLGGSTMLQAFAGTFQSFFRAYERLEYTALVVLAERGITIGVTFALLALGYGLLEIAATFLAGGGLSLALSIALVRRKFTWFSHTFDRRTASSVLRRAVPFALGAVISTIILSTGPVLLTILRSAGDAGLFNAGLSLLLIVLSILTLAHVVLLPTMARIRATNPERLASILEHTQRFFFALGLPVALGAALYARDIMTISFGPAFAGSAEAFRVLMGAVIVSSACIGNGAVLAVVGRQTENLYVGCAGALTLVGLSVVLITGFGPLGAAAGFVTGSAVTGILGTIITRRFAVRVDLRNILVRPSLAGGLMVFALFALSLPLSVGVPAGALVYFACLYGIGGIVKADWSMLRDAFIGALGREG
ncbi:MAG: flippase [Methanobacteriota archaeon]|nr:MAG: flippase [Euryarchaeota archaeon]